MARYIHWQIKFKSFAGVDCVVSIYKEGAPSDGIKQLTGGEIPVYWDEDDVDNLLNVVRVKTGYISFVEETFGQWDDVFPTTNVDRYVEVSYGGQLVFTGYLQAQSFENKWAAPPRELQIPIISHLGIGKGVTFDPNNIPGGQLTMGFFLKKAIEAIGAPYSKVVFPEITGTDSQGESYTRVTFNELIRTLVVCPYNDNYDRVEGSSDLYKIYQPVSVHTFIEGICNAYGWQVHETPSKLIFTKHDHTGSYLTRTVSTLDSETGRIQVFINSQITLDNYISICSDQNTISNILPLRRLDMDYGRVKIDSGEMDFGRCTLAKTGSSRNMAVYFRWYYWLNPKSDEFIGNLLKTGDDIIYDSQQERMQYDGCYLTFTYQQHQGSTAEGDEKKEEFRGIMIQWSTAWSAHTNLCRVRLPYPAGIMPNLITIGSAYYFPNQYKLSMHFAWAPTLGGISESSGFHSDDHEDFTIQVAVMNSSGKYWVGTPNYWGDNEYWLTVHVDGSTGDAHVCKFNTVNQVQNDSLLIFIRTNDNSNIGNHELIMIDSIKWEYDGESSFPELFERPVDNHIDADNGSQQTGSVEQFITPYVYSENLVGDEANTKLFTDYPYMFESQKHLTIDSRHDLPSDQYLHPYTYQGRDDWKLLADGFDPRNDEHKLILHTF